ncbi:uncharacterized protein BDV17DRAFT_294781 [Aspergillus undulatus]|uniref:uncharacterized protein n=1 Tax=Aspergillus undulatus TaxID=1810928 RepID=UPI003CCD2A24
MPPLGDLPTEILEQICELIAIDFPFNLYSLVLANRRCYAVGGKYPFLRIQINVVARHRLAVDIQHWESALRAYSALLSVRDLTVRGWMPSLSHERCWCPSGGDDWENDGQPEDELTRMDQHYKRAIQSMAAYPPVPEWED